MEKGLLLRWLEQPAELKKQDAAELLKVLHKYPYFQTAHLLYASLLARQKSYQLEIRLQTCALYAADRARLYDLTKFPYSSRSSTSAAATAKVEPELLKPFYPQSVAPSAPEVTSGSSVPITNESDRNEPSEKPVSEAEKILQKRLSEISTRSGDLTATQEKPAEAAPPLTSGQLTDPIEPPPFEIDKVFQAPEEEEEEEEVRPAASSSFDKKGTHSFTEWLKGKSEEHNSQKEEEEQAERKKADDLINNFIASEPRIKPAKAEFYSPVNMARKSLIENDEIISETLAQIYMKQGNLLRAQHIYEKLSLKYPEKSSSFAVEIEKIKALLKSS